uniref:Uncharacterized protein n=1 Tax=Arundo donax TaxID=35708 RepID=A0A0A9HHU4_ARUDO
MTVSTLFQKALKSCIPPAGGLDMLPSKPSESYIEFSFLQEYDEFNYENPAPPAKKKRGDVMAPSILLEAMEVPATSNVVESSKMLACCSFRGPSFGSAMECAWSMLATTQALVPLCFVCCKMVISANLVIQKTSILCVSLLSK